MTHKEKDQLIDQLTAKVKELQQVEKRQTSEAADLPLPGVGLLKDEKGKYHIVELKYDPVSKAAAVVNLVDLHSADPSIASFKIKEYVIEGVFRKTVGGKYNV